MTSSKEVLWQIFDRAIYKCEETEEKSQTYIEGQAQLNKLVHSGTLDAGAETDIYSYVASTQRIAYSTGFFEGAKLMHLLLIGNVNDLNEMVLDIIEDKILQPNTDGRDKNGRNTVGT